MNRLLRTLVDRADDPALVVAADTLRRHPPAAVAAAERDGLLAPLPPAEAVGCDSCGADHVEPVAWADAPDGPQRAFLWCPADGRVRVDPERLRRWAVRPATLGRAVTGAEPDERLPERVWKLGPVRVGEVLRVGWLVAGWRGETGLADRVPELAQPTAVVFVPADLPPAAVWGAAGPPVVVPLADVLTLTAAGLGVNPDALAAHLPAAPPDRPAHADSGKSNGRDEPPPADEPVVVAGSPPPVPLPPGTRWEDVCLHLDGDTVSTSP